jgi:plastocyanin
MVHTIVAEDGSWTTGALSDGAVGGKAFDKPVTYTYVCKEHPWAYGQIIVVE